MPSGVHEGGAESGNHDVPAGQVTPHQGGRGRPHIPDAGAEPAHVGAAHPFTEYGGGASRRELVGGHHLQEGGLARPVRPEQHPALARFHLPVDLRDQLFPRLHHGYAPEVYRQSHQQST